MQLEFKAIWTTLLILFIMGLGAYVWLIFDTLADDYPQIERYYEDGSGTLRFNNGTCVIPAFDSPGDYIKCYKED